MLIHHKADIEDKDCVIVGHVWRLKSAFRDAHLPPSIALPLVDAGEPAKSDLFDEDDKI